MSSRPLPPDLLPRFLADLVAGRREACRHAVTEALAQGVAVRDLYEQVFREALYEVGRRWERGEVPVSTEHLATAIVEDCMALAFPSALAAPRTGHTAVVSCAADEFHQVGGRMVADTLEARGWNVHFVGANTPVADLARLVAARHPDLVAISVSIVSHLPNAEAALHAVRAADPAVPIVLGGQAFDSAGCGLPGCHPGVTWLPSLEALEALLERWGS